MQTNTMQAAPLNGATAPVKLSGTVKEASFIKELNLSSGTFFKYRIAFEDGREGEYLSRSQDQKAFVPGQSTYYEFSIQTFGDKSYPKVKPVRQAGEMQAYRYKLEVAKQKCIVRQACQKTACKVISLFPQKEREELYNTKNFSQKYFEIVKMLETNVLDGIEF